MPPPLSWFYGNFFGNFEVAEEVAVIKEREKGEGLVTLAYPGTFSIPLYSLATLVTMHAKQALAQHSSQKALRTHM